MIDEICGLCDLPIKNMKKAILGIIENQTYDEPAIYGYICLSCQQEQERDLKLEQEYFEKLEKLGILDNNDELSCDNNNGESNDIVNNIVTGLSSGGEQILTTKNNDYRITVKCTYDKLNELLEYIDGEGVDVTNSEELVSGNFQSIGLEDN